MGKLGKNDEKQGQRLTKMEKILSKNGLERIKSGKKKGDKLRKLEKWVELGQHWVKLVEKLTKNG